MDTQIELKRSYDPESPSDGYRILVDRLWPQGLSHADFHYDLWAKDIAPSAELRHLLHDNPQANDVEFTKAYEAELRSNPNIAAFVKTVRSHPKVTFLFSSKNREENNAVVLRDFVMSYRQ